MPIRCRRTGDPDTKRSLGLGAVALFLLAVVSVTAAPGNRDFGRTVPDVREVSEEEAEEILQSFRSARGGMDSILEATLIHFPRRGEKVEKTLWIRAGWTDDQLDCTTCRSAPTSRALPRRRRSRSAPTSPTSICSVKKRRFRRGTFSFKGRGGSARLGLEEGGRFGDEA